MDGVPIRKAASCSLQSNEEEEPDISEPPAEETDTQSAASPLERPQRRSITSYTVVPSGS